MQRTDMRSGRNAAAFKYLCAYSSREHQRSGYSSREVTAAARVVCAVVAEESRVIRVRRTRDVRNVVIVRGVLLGLEYDGGKRSSGRPALVESRKYLREILFKPERGRAVFLCSPARHEFPDLLKVERLACGEVVKHDAYAPAVALAENGNGDTAVKQ